MARRKMIDSWMKRLGPLTSRVSPLLSKAGALPRKLPKNLQETLQLRGFGLFRIPLLFFISPSVVEMSDQTCIIKIPLNRRTKNHLGSMYFGVLATGADCAAGLVAMQLVLKSGMTMVFKDFQADFLKRAEGDVFFRCDEGPAVRELVERARRSGERENLSVRVTATVPSKLGNEPVANFVLTLSIKKKA